MNNQKEAKARILINDLLHSAGWRFFDSEEGRANVQLELNTKIKATDITELGDDFEKCKNGFVDYLLLDEKGNPFVVVEAKSTKIHPLTAKEQARKYAQSLRVKYIILSNGLVNYFWNLEKGNPEIIISIPSYESLKESKALNVDSGYFVNEKVDEFYIARSQDPGITTLPDWSSTDKTKVRKYCAQNKLRVLRNYQLDAIRSVQNAVSDGKMRFLFEMATGTGKTLTSAALIKLFIRSELANRVLFLVDRIELEKQAKRDLRKYLSKDGIRVEIYKEHKSDWHSADVVISTIQSLSYDEGFKQSFGPTDFDFVISDEAHRSLGNSNRAVLEYFIGYKLGLTATPKNYLKGITFDNTDPRELERRMMLDTYQIFGCSGGNPTFSYTLNDGVRDGILINPRIVDARTNITTKLLSDEGLVLNIEDDNVHVEIRKKGDKNTEVFGEKSYEKKFFSDSTNRTLCETFIMNAQRDPLSDEIGKSIIFCVNIEHARKITELLNTIVEDLYPGKYNSDFAVQITSNIPMSQDMTVNFANNNLNGKTRWLKEYDSSKTRVAVTVGMMTTGYDCPDILNLALFRPVFSPSEFIQIKGRGTRLHTFEYMGEKIEKEFFKLFDFFAVCEYFEDHFNYDEKLELPKMSEKASEGDGDTGEPTLISKVLNKGIDYLKKLDNIDVPFTGMKIDQKFYQSFEDKVLNDPKIKDMIINGEESALEFYLKNEIFDKPNEYYNVRKLERSIGLDRRLTVKEIALKLLGRITKYRTKHEILNEEFENFMLLNKNELDPYSDIMSSIETLFQAFILDKDIRDAVREKHLHALLNSTISSDFRKTKDVVLRGEKLMDYINEYVIINNINCDHFN